MAGSRDLYELIGTLSKTEKRYCRMMLEAGIGRKAASCLRLFEILSAMPAPDETALRAAVQRESFAGHLAVTKNHLYEHLLRSLRTFGMVKASQTRARTLIETAMVLADRGLYRQSEERLNEARELAELHGHMPEQLIIAQLEWRLDACRGYVGTDPDDLRERRERVENIMKDISNYWDYLHVHATFSQRLLLHGPGTGEEEPAGWKELAPPSTPKARRLRYDILCTYYTLTGRHDEGYAHTAQEIQCMESAPVSGRTEQIHYVSMLHHQVGLAIKTGRHAEAREAFEKMRAHPPADRSLQARHREVVFGCRLDLLMLDPDHEAIAAMAPELEEILAGGRNSFTRQLELDYAMAHATALFANGHMREAIAALHPIINDHRPGFRDDTLCIARMLRLAIHYEMGDIELLPYLIRSTYRFIAGCRGISGIDRVLLRFMRRLPNIVTEEELQAAFARVHEELTAAEFDPAERDASAIACILPWLEKNAEYRSTL